MAGSLLDFGEIAQRAQQQVRDAMQMQQLDLQGQNLQLHQQQQKINETNATTERMNALGGFLKDERVRFDPKLEASIISSISRLAGGPDINFHELEVGRQAKREYAEGLITGNAALTAQGAKSIALTLSMPELDKMLMTTVQYPKIHEDLLAMKQAREENAEKFEKLQYDNARVAVGRPQYSSVAASLRDTLNITKNANYEKMERLYGKLKASGGNASTILGTQKVQGVDKTPLMNMLNGQFGTAAQRVADTVSKMREDIASDQRALDAAEKEGIAPQDGTSKAMLRARIETNSAVASAYQSLQEWYEEPFDTQKKLAAIEGHKSIESRRLDIEALDKNTHADTIRIQQETLADKQEKERLSRAQESAEAEGQRRFLALPEKQRNGTAAGKISRDLKEELGVDVLPAKIYKDPNAPASQVTVNNAGESEYVKGFAKKQVDRDDSLRSVAEKGQELIDRASRIRELLNSKDIITGAGADFRLSFAKGLKTLGWSDTDSPENTEQLAADLSQNTLDHIKASGLGTGNGFTEKDLKFLQDATGGRINLERGTMLRLSTIQENVARAAINKWNARLKTIPQAALDGLGLDRTPMAMPLAKAQPSANPGKAQPQGREFMSIKSDEEFNKLPSGTIFIGPDGKKRRKP